MIYHCCSLHQCHPFFKRWSLKIASPFLRQIANCSGVTRGQAFLEFYFSCEVLLCFMSLLFLSHSAVAGESHWEKAEAADSSLSLKSSGSYYFCSNKSHTTPSSHKSWKNSRSDWFILQRSLPMGPKCRVPALPSLLQIPFHHWMASSEKPQTSKLYVA